VRRAQASWIHRNPGNRIPIFQNPHALATTPDRNKNYKNMNRDEGDAGDKSKDKDELFSLSPSSPSSLLNRFDFALCPFRGKIYKRRLIG
jgi:hypothetical protein